MAEGLVHAGCMLAYLEDRLGAAQIAARCGYREELA